MTRGDWQFTASTVLSLALGIPAIQTFANGDASLIALTALVTTICCATIVYAWHRSRLPLFTVHSVDWVITLKDAAGDRAMVRKTILLWANHPGADTVVHRGNGSDGKIIAFRTDDGVTGLHQENGVDGITVRARFHNALPVGARTVTWLEADHEKGFTRASEYFVAQVDLPMKRLTVAVDFPDARRPKRLTVVRRYASKDLTLLDASTNEKRVTWGSEHSLGKVPFGEYHVRW